MNAANAPTAILRSSESLLFLASDWPETLRSSESAANFFFLDFSSVDGAKNPTHRPIKKIVQELRENVATIDEELKVKTSEYAAAKAQLSGISRKTGGSLATRDLGDIVQESDVSFFCCSTS